MVFLHSCEAMISITLLVAVGYAITWKGWVTPATEAFMPKLLVKVVIPPYLMSNVCLHFQREQLLEMIRGSLVPLTSVIICFILFRLLAAVLRVQKKRRWLFTVGCTFSNTILIGIPVNLALFGESALPNCLVYFFANSFMFWTLGAWVVAMEGQGHASNLTVRSTLRQLFQGPLLGMLLGVGIVLSGLTLPKVLLDTCRYLGGISTPLALLYAGVIVRRTNWDHLRYMGRDLLVFLVGRVVITPAILVALLQFVALPPLMEQVFVIQSSLPVIMTVAIYSGYVGADKEYGSLMVASSTIVAMVTVPFWMTSLGYLL